MADKLFIGVDVAQDWVDIATTATPGQCRRIANTQDALRAWVAQAVTWHVAESVIVAGDRTIVFA